jgi:glutamate synthase (NADPH) small chain
VMVFGGGNVAMDSVQTAKRLGAKHAICCYRRSRAEMPARAEEIAHAEEEGVEFLFLRAPVEILGDEKGWVRAVRVQKMELGEPDESGRRCFVPLEGCEEEIPCDLVIVALGTLPNPLLTCATPELGLSKWKNICVDERQATSMDKVFAGGDIVRGNATVILAMGDGKNAAQAIDEYLKQKKEAAARSTSMAFSRS